LFIVLLLVFPLSAQLSLSDEARISLLTCSPSEEAVFTVYGHTAIRVSDPAHAFDLVFNYGLFDFSKDDFIYRFTKGETDYKLGVTHFVNFLDEYRLRGSGVVEQQLNLTSGERQRIWESLQTNLRPENAIYRYNFFFDNCSTRPAAIVERSVVGEIVYHHEPVQQTFRQLINYHMRNKPWLIFGCELALGSPADRLVTQREAFFLPLLLESAFDEATVVSPGGEERPLVSVKRVLQEDIPEPVAKSLFSPPAVSLAALVLVVFLSWLEWRKKTYYLALDCFLFTSAGLAGLVLFFLAFVSVHPATSPNYLLLWLHPFHLAGVLLFVVKKGKKAAYCYHFINFAALTLMLAGGYFIPQHFNAAFFPLIACLWVRSGRSLLLKV
jgi:hypothetical protein